MRSERDKKAVSMKSPPNMKMQNEKKRQPSYSNRFDNNNNEIPHINTYINGDKNEKKTEEIGKQFAAASA